MLFLFLKKFGCKCTETAFTDNEKPCVSAHSVLVCAYYALFVQWSKGKIRGWKHLLNKEESSTPCTYSLFSLLREMTLAYRDLELHAKLVGDSLRQGFLVDHDVHSFVAHE